ncbi:hypothetical protein FPV67DRAFT_1462006 [Lyophyllum atratum]|nr:hypothetical protein FPV67DRAFT_1462006 [Lyophyllum atratum]
MKRTYAVLLFGLCTTALSTSSSSSPSPLPPHPLPLPTATSSPSPFCSLSLSLLLPFSTSLPLPLFLTDSLSHFQPPDPPNLFLENVATMPELQKNNDDDVKECPRELRSDFSLRPLRKVNAPNYGREPEFKNREPKFKNREPEFPDLLERVKQISYMTKAWKMNELEKLAAEVPGEVHYRRIEHTCESYGTQTQRLDAYLDTLPMPGQTKTAKVHGSIHTVDSGKAHESPKNPTQLEPAPRRLRRKVNMRSPYPSIQDGPGVILDCSQWRISKNPSELSDVDHISRSSAVRVLDSVCGVHTNEKLYQSSSIFQLDNFTITSMNEHVSESRLCDDQQTKKKTKKPGGAQIIDSPSSQVDSAGGWRAPDGTGRITASRKQSRWATPLADLRPRCSWSQRRPSSGGPCALRLVVLATLWAWGIFGRRIAPREFSPERRRPSHIWCRRTGDRILGVQTFGVRVMFGDPSVMGFTSSPPTRRA